MKYWFGLILCVASFTIEGCVSHRQNNTAKNEMISADAFGQIEEGSAGNPITWYSVYTLIGSSKEFYGHEVYVEGFLDTKELRLYASSGDFRDALRSNSITVDRTEAVQKLIDMRRDSGRMIRVVLRGTFLVHGGWMSAYITQGGYLDDVTWIRTGETVIEGGKKDELTKRMERH